MASYVKSLNLSIGPANLVVSMYVIRDDKAPKTRLICPACADPTTVEQRYICTHDTDHGPYPVADLLKARVEPDKTLTKLDPNELDEAKKSDLPKDILELSVFLTANVDKFVFPSGSAYVLTEAKTSKAYGALVDIVDDDSDLTLLGMGNIRGNEGLYRLGTWHGLLLLEKLDWPEDLASTPDIQVARDPNLTEMLRQFARTMVREFEPDEYRNSVRERVAALGGTTAAAATPKPKKTTDDALLDALKASLAKTGA